MFHLPKRKVSSPPMIDPNPATSIRICFSGVRVSHLKECSQFSAPHGAQKLLVPFPKDQIPIVR
jgi:hypothetical protein